MKKYIERFWTYVDIKGPNDCWSWTRCATTYGYFSFNKKLQLTHRIAYALTHGWETIKGKVIRHKCDNTLCCNPKHLIAGTQQDNMNDKIERGRARYLKGNECSWSKLTEQDVFAIKALLDQGVLGKDVASMYNVHKMTISDIKLGRTWSHM